MGQYTRGDGADGGLAFGGLHWPSELRSITRAYVIAWRMDLEKRGLAAARIHDARAAPQLFRAAARCAI